jgi:LytR cell envelope-related transcriptional attenuator
MGRVNLSPARLAVLVALVVGGIAVMLNGFGDEGSAVAGGDTGETTPTVTESPGATSSPSPTRTESPAPQLEPQVDGVPIQVLNGTDATGLAAEVEQLLVGKGYEAALPADDAEEKPVSVTTVYFRTGDDEEQNEANADHLARRFLKGVDAAVRPLNATLDSAVGPKSQLVVLLGQDYAEANPIGG